MSCTFHDASSREKHVSHCATSSNESMNNLSNGTVYGNTITQSDNWDRRGLVKKKIKCFYGKMTGNYDEMYKHIKAKFSEDERPIKIVEDACLICPEGERRERIVVIVEYEQEKALFILLSACFPPNSFSDLTIERALPIDKDFTCDIDDHKRNGTNYVHLTVTSRKSKFVLELKPSKETGDFVEHLYIGVDFSSKLRTFQKFTWLHKYNGGSSRNKNDSSDVDSDNSPDIVVPRQNIAQGSPLTARESIIKYYMQMKEDDYMDYYPFKIFIATWNVNGQPPSVPLQQWLCIDTEPPDVYVVGFQELDLSKEAFLFDATIREAEWYSAVVNGLDKRAKYCRVEVVRLIGIMLMVLVQEKHYDYVKNVASDTVGTGFMGKFGNKGGVSIRFDLYATSLCFVNSHLAAHQEEYERRNQDWADIMERTNFFSNTSSKGIRDHDQIFWLGDLNYRITEMDHATVKHYLSINNYLELLQVDQLKMQQKLSKVFLNFKEGSITFPPTYKYDPGTDNFDSSEKSRAPAWCDRVLWKAEKVEQLSYTSHPQLNISDHKPVTTLFRSQIRITDMKKYRKVLEDIIKKSDKLENEFLPHVTVEPTEIVFNTVRFLEPQTQEVCIANTGQVPVQFEFIKKMEESSYCKDWLNISPHTQYIRPGEKCDVKLEVFVSKKSAFKFNSGVDKLYDILVLHLDGGKDIFITVTGTYERSCFGSSIEALVHMKVPISEMPTGKVIDYENEKFTDSDQTSYSIPKELWFLCDHLYRHGLKKPNLFRQPGLHSEMLLIRDWLDRGSVGPLPGSIHSIAEAIFLFLESTSEPIIPYNLHTICLSSSSNYLQCKQLVMQLPEYKKNVFLYLCSFLQDVLRYSADNGTDSKLVAILFGCTFLRDLPNNQMSGRARSANDQKKCNFVHHFLVNDQSDFISQ